MPHWMAQANSSFNETFSFMALWLLTVYIVFSYWRHMLATTQPSVHIFSFAWWTFGQRLGYWDLEVSMATTWPLVLQGGCLFALYLTAKRMSISGIKAQYRHLAAADLNKWLYVCFVAGRNHSRDGWYGRDSLALARPLVNPRSSHVFCCPSTIVYCFLTT